MGADDSNRPHPAAQNQLPVPCDDQGPRPVPWDNLFPPRVAARQQQQPQVSKPASYAIAGKILFASAGALAGVLLALVALHLYYTARRARLGGGGGGSGGRRRLDRSPAIAGADEDRNDGASVPSPRGLDPAVLGALPVAVAGAGAGDCAVCLAELEPGDKARALPRCGHVFHVECIDAWFRGNATCPLCRADVVAPDAATAGEPQPEVRIDVAAGLDAAAAGKASVVPAMGRLASGTDLGKTRRIFASTRSVSF